MRLTLLLATIANLMERTLYYYIVFIEWKYGNFPAKLFLKFEPGL